MNKETQKSSIWKNCITIPNMLSVFRLILIPFRLCLRRTELLENRCAVALSGISDTADGYIARRFNMVSDLGKIALTPWRINSLRRLNAAVPAHALSAYASAAPAPHVQGDIDRDNEPYRH